ncbi:hypothetical protein KCP78_03695 [Salmonella enterica subsp. enterica]|nr:hypothetical protein KCP78_03695 [Salmonella enterica subsp. enterica]
MCTRQAHDKPYRITLPSLLQPCWHFPFRPSVIQPLPRCTSCTQRQHDPAYDEAQAG